MKPVLMILSLTNVKHVQTTISNGIYSPIKVYSPSLAKRIQNIVFNKCQTLPIFRFYGPIIDIIES